MTQQEQFGYILNMIKSGKNPQEVVINLLEQQVSQTPLGANLLTLAKAGNGAEIEKIARNLVTQRGGNFDEEFNAFKSQWGLG